MKAAGESITEGIDLTGTTALARGATRGLGRECARVLAMRGAEVLLPCRSLAKGEATVAENTRGPTRPGEHRERTFSTAETSTGAAVLDLENAIFAAA